MNYCTKCESYYQKPGTCNCYAQPVVSPSVPFYPWVQPTYPGTPWNPASPTITWGMPPGCTVTTTTGPIIGNDPSRWVTTNA